MVTPPEIDLGRQRVSAAVLRNAGGEILLVQHRRKDGSSYWQLPGGGVLPDETLEAAVLRELHEETGLTGRMARWLFTIPYRLGRSTTFLVAIDADDTAMLGYDPEEQGERFPKAGRGCLVAVAREARKPRGGDCADSVALSHINSFLSQFIVVFGVTHAPIPD